MGIKKEAHSNWETFPIFVALLGMLLIAVFEPLAAESYISLGVWICFFSMGLCILFMMRRKNFMEKNFYGILLLFVAVVSFLISFDFTRKNMVALMCFIELPVFLMYLDKDGQKNIVNIIYLLYYLISCYYIILSFSSIAYRYFSEYGSVQISDLTLGLRNPNQTGIYLLIMLFVLTNAFANERVKRIFRIALLINIVWIFTLIIQTNSRTCVILAAAHMAFLIVGQKINLNKLIIFLAVISPFIFLLFILCGQEIYKDLIIFGTAFETGRFDIYLEILSDVTLLSFFFGDFSTYRFSNAHNSAMAIFATGGIILAIVFFIFLYKKLTVTTNKNISLVQKIALFDLLLLLVHSCLEAAVFMAGSLYAVSVMVLYCICRADKE